MICKDCEFVFFDALDGECPECGSDEITEEVYLTDEEIPF
ncbi:MAG TPA: zinc ribbon domain-containing protein [Syntrophomonadaceae bacterium]|nr:zinc ribbon domain-containing protein [Syntrophomonadaceae bacterium]